LSLLHFVSHSPQATQDFACRLGALCPDGLVLLLTGDLGSGKTCFVQGLAAGLGVDKAEPVTSPTYALMNQYHGRYALYHFDLYRLADADELDELGFDEIFSGPGVKAVEWPGLLEPAAMDGVQIRFAYGADKCERRLELTSLGSGGATLLAQLLAEKEQG